MRKHNVKVGQWWSYEGGEPKQVESIDDTYRGNTTMSFGAGDWNFAEDITPDNGWELVEEPTLDPGVDPWENPLPDLYGPCTDCGRSASLDDNHRCARCAAPKPSACTCGAQFIGGYAGNCTSGCPLFGTPAGAAHARQIVSPKAANPVEGVDGTAINYRKFYELQAPAPKSMPNARVATYMALMQEHGLSHEDAVAQVWGDDTAAYRAEVLGLGADPCTAALASLPKSEGMYLEGSIGENEPAEQAINEVRKRAAVLREWPCCPVSHKPYEVKATVREDRKATRITDCETVRFWHAEFCCTECK